jgi:hypothetical protein
MLRAALIELALEEKGRSSVDLLDRNRVGEFESLVN